MTGMIERVVVTLDAASENRPAIDTAALLAARAKAPLHGVFVEDDDLLRVAGLPFARQTMSGVGVAPLTLAEVELHLRAAAERARRDLLAAARAHDVAGTFAVVRGAAASALAEVTAHDLVVAGALTRPVAGHFRVACRWWSSIEAAPGPFLLARHAWHATGSVALLLRDRGPAANRLLATAAEIAIAGGGGLTVIALAAIGGADVVEQWTADRLGGQAPPLRIAMAPEDPAALRRLLGDLDCRLLAIDAGMAEAGTRLRDFFERLACDILIVR